MKFDVIGFHPTNAIKVALSLFDNQQSVEEKVKLLLNNRPVSNLNSIDLPKNFASGKTIDLNAGELLGIGCVAAYYNWSSEQTGTGNTYQAVVGIEDPGKRDIETLLSDGGIWHNQEEAKILAQQVMAQGYFPEKTVTNADVLGAIRKKMEKRDSYPENCILIVNVFSDNVAIDRETINGEIKSLTNAFTDVYVVVYNLPLLTLANVSYVSQIDARGLTIQLERHQYENEWRFNYGGKK